MLCALEVVKINILGVCCAKGSVFLEGLKVTSVVVLCVIYIHSLVDCPVASGDWMKVFLNHVRKSGAEAMKVCEQDPPKSGVDLEGA